MVVARPATVGLSLCFELFPITDNVVFDTALKILILQVSLDSTPDSSHWIVSPDSSQLIRRPHQTADATVDVCNDKTRMRLCR